MYKGDCKWGDKNLYKTDARHIQMTERGQGSGSEIL